MNRNQNKRKLPPFCPACDAVSDIWERREKTVGQVFRKETFQVKTFVTECKNCGFGITGGGDSESMVHATWNAYREKHGLLHPREIVSRRKALGLTQKEFADRLGVGVASIKRWEKGLVQDKSSDNLIRKMTETEADRRNVDVWIEKDASAASMLPAKDFRHAVIWDSRVILGKHRILFDEKELTQALSRGSFRMSTNISSKGAEIAGTLGYVQGLGGDALRKSHTNKWKEERHEENELDLTPAA